MNRIVKIIKFNHLAVCIVRYMFKLKYLYVADFFFLFIQKKSMYNQQLQALLPTEFNDMKLLRPRAHWKTLTSRQYIQHNFCCNWCAFLSSLFCWSGRSETFYCDYYDDTHHIIRTLNNFFFFFFYFFWRKKKKKHLSAGLRSMRCEAITLQFYNEMFWIFELIVCSCAMCVPCVCFVCASVHAYYGHIFLSFASIKLIVVCFDVVVVAVVLFNITNQTLNRPHTINGFVAYSCFGLGLAYKNSKSEYFVFRYV